MHSVHLLSCFLLPCAVTLLLSVTGVQSLAVPLVRWRLLSHSTGRFLVLRSNGEVDADGTDMDVPDVYMHSVDHLHVQIVTATSPSLLLALNATTGDLQAVMPASAQTNDPSILSVFQLVTLPAAHIYLAVNVSVPVSCELTEYLQVPKAGQEGSGSDLAEEASSCSETRECAVVFHKETKRPLNCYDQQQDSLTKAEHSLSLIYWQQ